MSKETIQSAINMLARKGYLDGHNESMLQGAINALNRGVVFEAERVIDTVVINYQKVGNFEAAQIVANAR